MTAAVYKEGSATIGATEYSLVTPGTTLATDTTPGTYQVDINTLNMAAGDEYIIQIYEKIIAADAKAVIYASTLEGAQSRPEIFPALILMKGWDVTIKKVAGTDRVFTWSIRTP